MDSGMFFPIQKAATKALELENDWFDAQNTDYKKRRAILWEICETLNLSFDKSAVGLFVWGKVNSSQSAKELADELLYKRNVFVTPGDVFGSNGSNYLRFSLCVSEEELSICKERISKSEAI